MLVLANSPIRRLFVLVIFAVMGAMAAWHGIAFANNTSGALHTAVITILNTGTLRTNYRAAFNMSGSALVDDGFITSNGLNTLVAKGGAHIPGMPPTNRIDIAGAIQNDNGVTTDYTTAATNATTNDVALLPVTPSPGDEFYFGMHNPGRILSIDIGQAGVGGWTLNWQYRGPTNFTNLSNVFDATNGFRNVGLRTVSFDMPTDWTSANITGSATSAYWMRAVVTGTGNATTQPLANRLYYENGQWWVWDDSLDTNQEEQYQLYLGGPAMVSRHQTFPGTGGVTTPDSASLELGSTYAVEIEGRLSFQGTGNTVCIVCKGSVFRIYPSSASALTLEAVGAGTTTLTVSGITLPGTGSQTVKATSSGGSLVFEVVGFGSATGTAQTITNTADDYVWASNHALVYFDKVQISFPSGGNIDTFDTQGQWNTGTFSNTESAAGQPTDLEKRFTYFVEASTDDGEWIEGTSEFFNSVTVTDFGFEGTGGRTSVNTYARFASVPIAQGTTISQAYLTFQPGATTATTTVNARISAVAADNPNAPGNFAEANGNPRTTAFADWNNVPTFTTDVDINSVDFTSVVQEMVNRSDWNSGDAMLIYVEDNGSTAVAGTTRRSRTWDTSVGVPMNTIRLTIVPSGIPSMADDFIRASDVGTTASDGATTNEPLGWNGLACTVGPEERQTENTEQFSGNWSERLEADVDQNSQCNVFQQFAASPGQTWGVGVMSRLLLTTADMKARLQLQWVQSDGTTIISSVTSDTSTAGRHTKTATGVAPALTAFARINLEGRCVVVTCGTPRDVFFDRAIICQCATVPAFTDASNQLTNPSFEKVWTSGGTWTSPNLAPTNTNVASTSVTWTAQEVSGTTLLAQTSIDNQATWQTVTNGGSIPGISAGQDISSIPVHLRFTTGSTGADLNLVTPFVGIAQVTFSDTTDLEMKYELNTLPSNTIADRTGHGHTGTMTFPVQLANISTFVGPLMTTHVVISQEQALGPQSLTAAVTGAAVDAQLFNTTETGSFLPGHGLVNVAATNAKIPIAWFWAFFALLTILATGVLFARLFSANLMVPAIAMGVMLLFWGLIGDGLIPLWTLFIYLPVALAFLLLRPRLPL